MGNVLAALDSLPWRFSGFAHLLSGFLMPIIGFGIFELFKNERPTAARIALMATLFAGIGYMMTGINDISGLRIKQLLMEYNPGNEIAYLMSASYMRNMAVILGVGTTGWFAAQLSWLVLRTGKLSKTFGYFSILAALAGLGMFVIFTPYLLLYPIWTLWLGILLLRTTAS